MTDDTPHPGGRPSSYSPEIATQLCALLAEGISLRTACRMDGMPDTRTVFRWLGLHEEFRLQYARAKEASADAMAEEILDIADDGTNDFVEVTDKKGKTQVVFDKEAVMRSRLRVDTRRWLMAKMKPKKYGEASLIKNQPLNKDGEPTDQPAGLPALIIAPDDFMLRAVEAMKKEQEAEKADEDDE